MLNSIHLNDKSYEDLYFEALSQISIYSKEWTNFNTSDPGITLLENLTAFNFMQQNRIDEVTDDIRLSLLKLLDHRPAKNSAARLLAQPPAKNRPIKLSAQYSLKTGDINFETEQVTHLYNWSVSHIYSVEEGGYRDITYLMDSQNSSAAVFGTEPQNGNSLCLIINGDLPVNDKLYFWVETTAPAARNPFPEIGGPVFGKTHWQFFTESGWQDVEADDETRGFLMSGAVTISLPELPCALFTDSPERGYALRCVLDEANYDHIPRIVSISGNLFPVSQRETLSRSFTFDGADEIVVESALAAKGALFVYCREDENGDYRAYREYPGMDKKGRFYTLELTETGAVIRFDSAKFGLAPICEKDAVKVVCCTEDMLHHRSLGVVYGYDDQVIKIDFVNDIIPDDFSLIAEIPDENGGNFYRFVFPGKNKQGEISYELLSHEGAVRITDPGVGTEYHLYLCDCAFTRGAQGNIRKNSVLTHAEGQTGMQKLTYFAAPSPARGGSSWESPEQLRLRFAAGMKKVNTAVTTSDYEFLAKNTPGLCIHKVNAWADAVKNTVSIVVKPQSGGEKFPVLSEAYQQEIAAYLNERRMLTTKIELLQPRYVPINVIAVLRVKRHYQSVEEQVRELLKNMLDHIESDDDFGGMVHFDEVYRALSRIPGIAAIDALRLMPDDNIGASMVGTDIALAPESLCCPGEIKLEFHNEIVKRR